MGVSTTEPRNPQGVAQRDLLNQWKTETSSAGAIQIYMEAFPDKSGLIQQFLDESGADSTFDIIQESLIDPAESGMRELRELEGQSLEQAPEAISELPETPPTQQPQAGAAKSETESRSPFAVLAELDSAETAGRAQAGEMIAGAVSGFGAHLKEEYVAPYLEAKRNVVDKPLAKLQKKEREGIRKAIAGMRKNTVYLPTVEETKELVAEQNWPALRDLAEDGRLPTEEELGAGYIETQLEAFSKEGNETQIAARGRIMARLFNDPSASWLRRGEVKTLGPEFIAKHPRFGVLPLVLTAPAEVVARIATTPTEWDDLVAYYSGGRLVLQPATKLGIKYLSTKGWATKPLHPLQAVGRKFPKKQPVSVADIQAILKSDPDVGDDILKAFTNLSNKEKADIARAVKMGKPVHLATPRFKGGDPAFGQPPVERLDFGIQPEHRPFFAPVPVTTPGQPVAPPTVPVGEPVFGVQENLPILYEGSIAEQAAQVPLTDIPIDSTGLAAQPLALTEGQDGFVPGALAGLRRPPIEQPEFFPPVVVPDRSAIPLTQFTRMTPDVFAPTVRRKPVALLPPPQTPSRLARLASSPAVQSMTGLSSDIVGILRRSGITDQQIIEMVGPELILPTGVESRTAADAGIPEIMPLAESTPRQPVEAPPVVPAEAIPLPAGEELPPAPAPAPIAEKPVRVIPKRSKVKKGKIQVLPDKARVLTEIDAAIKTAPKRNDLDAIRRAVVGQESVKLADIIKQTDLEEAAVKGHLSQLVRAGEIQQDRQLYRATENLATAAAGGDTLTFKMDGGTIQVQNNKQALTQVRKLVAKVPLTMDAPGVERKATATRTGISPNREQVGELVKGAPEGYFTDGKIIVKGTPPKSAKFDPADREILPKTVLDMLKRPTDAADLQYYALAGEEDIGVSSEPIVSFKKEQTPWAIFRTGNKFVAFNQYMVNAIKKRYPDAKYGVDTTTGMMVAYDENEPVGAVMGMKVFGNEEVMMDVPPAYTMATEAGLIEELAHDAKDVAELQTLGYDRGQIERLTGVNAREVIAAQTPGGEVLVDKDGNITKQGGAKNPRPRTGTTEELTAENVKVQDKIREENLAGGFVGFRQRSPHRSPKPRKQLFESSKRVTGDDEFATAFYQSRDDAALWQRIKRSSGRLLRESEDLIFAEANNYLWRAAKKGKYAPAVNAQIAQFANKNRTQYQNTRDRGMQIAHRDAYGIWGELDAEQSERLANLIYLKRIQNTLSRGLPETADIQAKEARILFNDHFRAADHQVRDSFERYDKFQKAFSYQHLVDRGKLNPEHVFHFYSPEKRLDYYWGGFLLPEPAKPRFRGYLQKQTGSHKGSRVSLDIIAENWGVVHSDNMYEDFMLEDLTSIDQASRAAIRAELGDDNADALFKNLRPVQSIPVKDAGYRVVQFEPGRVMFPALVANPELLRRAAEDAALDHERLFTKGVEVDFNQVLESGAGLDAERVISRPPDEQEDMLGRYFEDVGPRGGDAIRRAMVLGRYKQLYVVPEEVSWRLRAMRDKPLHIPLLRQMTTLSSYWKGIVLTWAGVKFHAFQALFLDTPLQYLTAPGSVTKIPRAFKMVNGLHKLLVDPGSMGPEIQETYEIARDEGVFDSGFLREYMMLKPDWTTLQTWLQTPGRWGAKREVLNRLAMVDYQWHERVKKGKPIEAINFKKRMELLTPKQQVGFVARKFTVDFEGTPGWYRGLFRGFIFPFITGVHKGTQTYAGLIGRMPLRRPKRFLGSIVAPLAAIYYWNNTGWRKEIRDRLGWNGGKWYTTVLKQWDDDGDGEPNRVLIWSPRTSLDEAGEWVGVDLLLQRLRRLRRKSEAGILRSSDIDDFIVQTAKDMGLGPANKINELKTPLLQFWEGYKTNIDPFTKKQVMPKDVKGTPEESKYLAAYFVKKLISPLEQIAGGRRGKGIPAGVPATWNKWSRAIAGAVMKGPLDPFGALGFRVVDLVNIERSEIRAEKNALSKARLGFLRRLRDEFVYNKDIRLPGSVIDFYDNALSEFDAVTNGEAPTSEVGRIFEDAKERGVDLSFELSKGAREQGSVRNMLIHPRTWSMKITDALNQGITQTLLTDTPTPLDQPRHFTKEEKEELASIRKALEDIDLSADIAGEPFSVREELIREVLGVYGVDVEEVLHQLGTR